MKKKIWLIPIVLLAISLVATGCAPAVQEEVEEVMEPQKWDCISYTTGLGTYHDIELIKTFDSIKERTDGLLDIRLVPAGALPIKSEEWGRAVAAGDLEMAMICTEYQGGDYPIWSVIDIPFLFRDELEKREVWTAVRPIYLREMHKEGIHFVGNIPLLPISLHTKEPVDVMDLKGTTVRSYGKLCAEMIEAMGGVAAPVAWAETYTALERGLADGILTCCEPVYVNRMHELCPHSWDIGLMAGVSVLGIHKDLWDALPCWVREVVHEEIEAWDVLCVIWTLAQTGLLFDKMVEEGGGTHRTAPPEYIDLIYEAVSKPLMREAVAKAGAVGEEIMTALEQVFPERELR